jgi:death on curing protein
MSRSREKARQAVPCFLTTDQVILIHQEAIERHGGSPGLRDAGLLDSAVHAPQASFGGEFMYPSLFDMAAVYLIHLASNHAFIDGNKRTAWWSSKTFLRMNGISIKPRWDDIVDLMIKVASGEARDWKEISDWLHSYV